MRTRIFVIIVIVILVAMYFLMHARIWPEPEPCDVGFEHYHFGFCGSNLFAISTAHAQADDGTVVSFLDVTKTDPSSQIKWNVGKVEWLEARYLSSGVGVVRIIDPDMNLNPEKADNLDVFVWSDSHTKGVTQTATETGVSTGVFESMVFLSLTFDACCNRLKVAEGDTITAEYDDSTLPSSYTAVDVLRITAKSDIQAMLDSPLKQFKTGVPVDEIQCNKQLVLMAKHDGSPACMTSETKVKLVDRGWTTTYPDTYDTKTVFEIVKDEKIFDVEYKIKGGSVEDMVYDKYGNTLLTTIDSRGEGKFTVVIPRDLLDAKTGYCPPLKANPPDDRFFVLLDGKEIPYDEILTTSEKRTLQIPFTGDAILEIIGACLI